MARELSVEDLTHLSDLFRIHKEALAHGGVMKPIADAAYEQLREFAEGLVEVPPEAVVKGDMDAGSTVEGEQALRYGTGATETHFTDEVVRRS